MLDNYHIHEARKNWIRASKELGFEIIIPYKLQAGNFKQEAFAFLPKHGSPNGAIICLTSPPDFKVDKDIITLCRENGIFVSFLNINECISYNKNYFNEILEDWAL